MSHKCKDKQDLRGTIDLLFRDLDSYQQLISIAPSEEKKMAAWSAVMAVGQVILSLEFIIKRIDPSLYTKKFLPLADFFNIVHLHKENTALSAMEKDRNNLT